MAAETHRFLKNMEKQNQEFVKETEVKLTKKGFEVQDKLSDRIKASEDRIAVLEEESENCKIEIRLLREKIDEEYREFARNRKRWKSEFGLATEKADAYMEALKQTLESCLGQNQANSNAIKLLLDS